ncbi:MAG: ribonuclease P protein component [Planctomycetes bacterium]|jgi:ribonuclease P protein component|nr:ribonuclease P protein component [Planctomycetota bacterium]
MIFKQVRLANHNDFLKVFKTGRSYYSKNIGIRSALNDLGLNRIGILVGLRVSKIAVKRNKVKRIIRGILLKEKEELNSGNDIVVIVQPGILDKKSTEIEAELKIALKKAGLYN